jgi:hypothetical protein
MESALNAFLNEMYATSEYLSDVAASVRSSLEEMESLMSGAEAAEVEFQVQKWMGSLYSVGMSQEAVQSIASALGQIAAGQVDALTNGDGAGNLMVMAANKAGKSIADILTTGLTASETNELLQATVDYLAELANTAKDNKVVQQQLANVFGVRASDLKAATNLASTGSTSAVFGNSMTYGNMLGRLNAMAGTMGDRTSLGEKLTNIWDNGQYTIASSISSNPAAYLIYKLASLLDSTVGGIPLPFVSAAGFGVDLETTVADLMRVGAISVGILDSLSPMVAGLSNSFSGQAMLQQMGIGAGSGLTVTPRGSGGGGVGASAGGGASTSDSGYVGSSSGSDIKDKTIQEGEDSKDQLMIEALEDDIEHEQTHRLFSIDNHVIKIFSVLDDVASGKRNFTVQVAGYGLSGLTGSSTSGPQAGVDGLNNSSSGSNKNPNNSAINNGTGYGVGTVVDLGGWTIV